MLAPILSLFRKIHPASLSIMLGHEHNFKQCYDFRRDARHGGEYDARDRYDRETT